MKILRAALYGRLSKEDRDKIQEGDDSESIVNQRLLLTSYAVEHGFEIVGWYYDDDYSGLYNDRPDFERLIDDAQQKKFDVVIAKSQSRFTRNMEHMEKYLHTMFPILGIRFIGVVDNADTAVAANKKTRQINGLMNEWYCEDLSDNIKAVFRTKMKAGQYVAAHPPYGYIKNPEDKHSLIVDEYAASIVKRIFRMYISGMGKGAIGACLTKEGIVIPSVYKRDVLKMNYHNANEAICSPLWSYQTIHHIINDEMYTGTLVQAKYITPSFKSKKKILQPESEWIKIPNAHEAIIDRETWEIAKALQKNRTRSFNDCTKNVGLFGGLLKCPDCNKSLVRTYHRRTHEFEGYCCSTYKRFGNTFCSQHGIKHSELEVIVLDCIKKEAAKILTNSEIAELNNYSPEENSREKSSQHETINIISRKIAKIERYEKKSYEDYADGILDKLEYLKLKQQYSQEKEECMKQINELNNSLRSETILNHKYEQWIANFKNYISISELNREMLLEMIDKIEVSKDGDVHIQFKFKAS